MKLHYRKCFVISVIFGLSIAFIFSSPVAGLLAVLGMWTALTMATVMSTGK